MWQPLISLIGFALVATACGSSDDPVSAPSTTATQLSTSVATTTTEPTGSTDTGTTVTLLEGAFELPAAGGFGEPGFHETINLSGALPDTVASAGRLTVRLHEVTRPNQTCGRNHPLSGCATVDWSDFEDRPSVPAGGVFDNRLSLATTTGTVDLFLSETLTLASTPDSYSPT